MRLASNNAKVRTANRRVRQAFLRELARVGKRRAFCTHARARDFWIGIGYRAHPVVAPRTWAMRGGCKFYDVRTMADAIARANELRPRS